jgi:hypothetical protein
MLRCVLCLEETGTFHTDNNCIFNSLFLTKTTEGYGTLVLGDKIYLDPRAPFLEEHKETLKRMVLIYNYGRNKSVL